MEYEIINLDGRYAVKRTKKLLFLTYTEWLNFDRYERTARFLWFSGSSLFNFNDFTTDESGAIIAVNNIIKVCGGESK